VDNERYIKGMEIMRRQLGPDADDFDELDSKDEYTNAIQESSR